MTSECVGQVDHTFSCHVYIYDNLFYNENRDMATPSIIQTLCLQVHQSCESEAVDVASTRPNDWTSSLCDEQLPCWPVT